MPTLFTDSMKVFISISTMYLLYRNRLADSEIYVERQETLSIKKSGKTGPVKEVRLGLGEVAQQFFQRTQTQVPAPTSDSSQPPVRSAQGAECALLASKGTCIHGATTNTYTERGKENF